MKRSHWIALTLCVVAGVTLAATSYPGMKVLTGQFSLTGATPVDPAPEEPRNTHFLVLLTGEAARTLYDNMKAKPIRDVCLDDGTLTKTIGEMSCQILPNKKEYSCNFAIDIAKQKIASGWAC